MPDVYESRGASCYVRGLDALALFDGSTQGVLVVAYKMKKTYDHKVPLGKVTNAQIFFVENPQQLALLAEQDNFRRELAPFISDSSRIDAVRHVIGVFEDNPGSPTAAETCDMGMERAEVVIVRGDRLHLEEDTSGEVKLVFTSNLEEDKKEKLSVYSHAVASAIAYIKNSTAQSSQTVA